MRAVVMALALAAVAGAQQRGQRGMYGGISTGQMVGSISDPGFASRLGATVSGLPQTSGQALGLSPGIYSNPRYPGYPGGGGPRWHMPRGGNRTVVVPWGVPVVYGGFGGYYGGGFGYDVPTATTVVQPVQPAPSVIINQYYTPESHSPTMKEYKDLPEPAAAAPREDSGPVKVYGPPARAEAPAPKAVGAAEPPKATVTLLAFNDSSVIAALGYWTQGETLYFITKDYTKKSAPVSSLDTALSQQLNQERNVEFKLESLR